VKAIPTFEIGVKVALFFLIFDSLVPKFEICLRYFLVKNIQNSHYSTVHMCLLRVPARPPAPHPAPPSLRKVYIHETHGGNTAVAAAAVRERGSGVQRAGRRRCGELPQVQAGPGFIPANTCTSQQNSIHSR
jgi:hypothetical protein